MRAQVEKALYPFIGKPWNEETACEIKDAIRPITTEWAEMRTMGDTFPIGHTVVRRS